MKYHYKSTQRMAGLITAICFLLLVAYSLSLFIRRQSHMLALANFVASGCVSDVSYGTASSVWIAALLGTSLCAIPAVLLLHSFHFPIGMKGVAFLPSYVVLGLMTGIAPRSVDAVENHIPIVPAVVLLLFSVAAIFYSQMYHEDRGEHSPMLSYLGGNVLLACIGMGFCLYITNTDRQLHLQQPLAQAVSRGDCSFANTIPAGETTTNNTITALRILSLSRQGRMADELFSIPGLNGSCSLLPDTAPSALIYHTPKLVYNRLQAIPVNYNGDVTAFLEKAVDRRMLALQDSAATPADSLRARPLMDYYLCALLLDRDLHSFVNALPRFYAPGDTLPCHYAEALAICNVEGSMVTHFPHGTPMDSIYQDYLRLRGSVDGTPRLRRKVCMEAYPGTYWNYYSLPQDR